MRDSLLIILSKYMNSTTITLKFSVIVVKFIYTDTFAPPLSKSYLHPWYIKKFERKMIENLSRLAIYIYIYTQFSVCHAVQ